MTGRTWTQDLEALLGTFDAQAGVVVSDLSTGERFAHQEDRTFPAASLIKLPVLWTLFREATQGRLDLAEPWIVPVEGRVDGGLLHRWSPGGTLRLEDLALLMIAVSDNSAANALMDRLGIDRINAAMEELGLTGTSLQRKLMDFEAKRAGKENVTTPGDMNRLLTALIRSERIPADARHRMVELLTLQKLQSKLPREIPVDDVDDLERIVAHKTGELSGSEHDAGLFFPNEAAPVVAVVMTAGLRHRTQGEALGARIGRIVFDRFRPR